MSRLYNYIFGSVSFEVDSSFGIEESISRLSKIVKPLTLLRALTLVVEEEIVGTVSKTRVSLCRVHFLSGNLFRPVFIGKFVEEEGQTKLRGKFKMNWFGKVFFSFWFILFVLILILAIGMLIDNRNNIFFVGISVLFLIGDFTTVAYGKWLARKDIPRISEVIKKAICR